MEPILADISPEALRRADLFLASLDDDWRALVEEIGPCTHERRARLEPYAALISTVAHQHLHGVAAKAILDRWLELYGGGGFPSPQEVLDTPREDQRACGLSYKKIDAIQAIAEATIEGSVPSLEEAERMPNDSLKRELTKLPGIGPWTVDMLLMFYLGRSDILPIGDFGVREGYRRLKRLDKAPTQKELREIGEAWAPHRTAAAWYLWKVHK